MTYTATTLPRPTFAIREGQMLAVAPGEGPLLRWVATEARMGQHYDYDGTYRPNVVTVVRVARAESTTSNVRVRFHDPIQGREVETWVHHSFLLAPGTTPIDPAATRVGAVSAFMETDIGRTEWPGAGMPSTWLDSDRATWFQAGNEAVLNQRDRIEAGTTTAGAVWCRAARDARSFSYTAQTEAFLHDWFVQHREYLTTLMAEQARPSTVVRERTVGIRQDVWMPDGKMGMVLPDDTPTGDRRIRVYTRNDGTWTNARYSMDDLRWAVPGDLLIHDDGRTARYEGNLSDPTFRATLVDGGEVTWERQYVTFAADATPREPIENLTVTIGGVEYVRKDVVDKDIETLTTITHRKSVEHSLCGVYDETQRQVDAATTYMKMGPRYKDFDVDVEQVITVRRTIRVERSLNEEAAIESARRIASDYTLRTIEPRRTGETVRIINTEAPTTATARVAR